MQEDDPFEEFLKKERLEDFHKEEQTAKPVAQSMRSAADEIIEAIGGVKPRRKTQRVCKCGSTEFTVRTPLSGEKIHQCVKCGTRSYGVARSPVWMQGDATQHAQGSGGSYYRGPDVAPTDVETHSPKSRAKSRSYAALLEEENK